MARLGWSLAAAPGIGRATAELLAGEGATVAVLEVHDRGGNCTIDAITAAGGSAPCINCNVEHPNEIEDAINTVVTRYGRSDWAHNVKCTTLQIKRQHELVLMF